MDNFTPLIQSKENRQQYRQGYVKLLQSVNITTNSISYPWILSITTEPLVVEHIGPDVQVRQPDDGTFHQKKKKQINYFHKVQLDIKFLVPGRQDIFAFLITGETKYHIHSIHDATVSYNEINQSLLFLTGYSISHP